MIRRIVAALRRLLYTQIAEAGPRCPVCGDRHLVLLRSQYLKVCSACGTDIPWPLDQGQKPLFLPSRASRGSVKP
ncbi:hypothetical protein [Pseudomonas sp.]|jgi:DNA-directed RNA polymerase subunit RPC12/RpoP|uniref:hypothetical protein n=1 Tax=Pseudomonas sp. TaxID=306 RepID=UPI002EDB1CFE